MLKTCISILLITSIDFKSDRLFVDSRAPRIVGGRNVQIEEIPYMVNIRKNGTFYCGGSLITPKCVLTAAHCAYEGQQCKITVHAGATYLKENHSVRTVRQIFTPESYNPRTLEHDVAIFELSRSLKGDHIKTIKISNDAPQKGDFVQISGWGLTRQNGSGSQQLRSTYVAVLSPEYCRQLYRNYNNVTESMFCALIPGLRDACLGDSGGPVVLDHQVVGVVSWGRNSDCARKESPGVYVKIKAVKPWIDNIISEHCS